MKITFVGGGVYVPRACALLSQALGHARVDVCVTARHAERLRIIAQRAVAATPAHWTVRGLPREAALDGADLVIVLARIGGLAARSWDESFPRLEGLPGDEGLGLGGIANTWRTLPALRRIGADMMARCPDALVLNLMAPLGTTTRLLVDLGLRAYGVCELPVVTRDALGPKARKAHYGGLNHLGWFWDDALSPTPLKYFERIYGAQRSATPLVRRAEQLQLVSKRVLQRFEDGGGDPSEEVAQRPTPWFDHALVPLVAAFYGGPPWDGSINTVNDGLIPELPSEVVVEVLAQVRRGSVDLEPPGPLPDEVASFLRPVARAESLSYQAAVDADQAKLLAAIRALPYDLDAARAARLARFAMEPAPLHVVARLAAHQTNLQPPSMPPEAAVLALPSPPICAELDAAHYAAWRDARLHELAEEAGGGDGPLPIEDLTTGDTLVPTLARLASRGVTRLILFGARDQPGWARAVACRWSGALDVTGNVIDEVHRRDGDAVAPDPDGVMAPWSGFLDPVGRFGTERGQEARTRWTRRWSDRGRDDVVRQAALQLDPVLEEGLAPTPPPSPSLDAPVFAVTGLDGAGKSTHAARLCERLVEAGYGTASIKIYRHGAFLELADELGARTRRGAPLAAFVTSRIVKLVDSLRVLRDTIRPASRELDVLVMDRYIETHVAAAHSQLGWDLRHHPILQRFPAAAQTFWLRVEPRVAVERLRERGTKLTADEHPTGLHGYAVAFDGLAEGDPPRSTVLSSDSPIDHNAHSIASTVLATLPPPAGRTTSVSVATAATSRPGACIEVILGAGDAELPGDDVLALRRELSGPQRDAVPERFWVEAYVAQLILDLRTTQRSSWCLPLWPGALQRMWPDIATLSELTRIVRRHVNIVGYAPDPRVPLFEALAHPRALPRLRGHYLDELEACARAEGWDRVASARPTT